MPLTAEQLRKRDRVESLIRLMTPGLNMVLAVGDRLSRLVEPVDHEYYPPRQGQVEPPPAAEHELRGSED
jgi:hypothetical protein